MYVEYITPQRVADTNYTKYNSKGGDYRPTWLIRTSDWQKVPGTEATDGYHTLSYVWEQSGEKCQTATGEFNLIDRERHRVTTRFLEKRKTRRSTRYRWRTRTQHVSYDQLLQQVCKDFDIEYLWYDKICIDQTDKAEKYREIKQMHLIYSNARYTVALVPEIDVDDPEKFDRVEHYSKNSKTKNKAVMQMMKSLWFQRSWTLEELMMSTRILLVGRNTHFWSLANFKQGHKRKENDLLVDILLGFKEREKKSANQILLFAHLRTSTKEHDRLFALANILEDTISMDFDYDSDISTAMSRFYRYLAEKDLSLLCFGAYSSPEGFPRFATTMDSYNLPSWTGVAGLHLVWPITEITLDQNFDYVIDDNMQLHIQCRSYSIYPSKYKSYDVFYNDARAKKAQENYMRVITSMDDFDGDESEALDWSQWCMQKVTYSLSTHYHRPDDSVPFLSPLLPLSLTEECDECVILGVIFSSLRPELNKAGKIFAGYSNNYLSPVARKSTDGFSYRIIGVMLLKHLPFYEPCDNPQVVMDKMFNSLGCQTQEFCIK